MKEISSKAARRRLEVMAPEFAELLGTIKDEFIATLRDTETPLAVRLKIARELRQVSGEVLDRGGAPKLKQVQSHAVIERYDHLDEGQLLNLVAKRLKELGQEERKLLLDVNPELEGLDGQG